MTGGQALAGQLVREGVDQIFGVPGVQLDHAVDGLASAGAGIRFRNTRHEQAASYMADGYARSTGDVGVCLVVPGPGLLNAMAGLATAYSCSSPVLCVSGQIPSAAIGKGLGMLHEVNDQTRTLGTVTKWTGMARTPAEVPQVIREAFRRLRSGRPQPVGVEIPPDVLQASADVSLVEPGDDRDPVVPDADAIERAAAVLRGASRPVIYVGGGVPAGDAGEPLRRLAELLEAPVVMSEHGRGSLSDRHRLALTQLGGREVLPGADAVLVVGSRFLNGQGRQVAVPASAKVVLLNADAHDLGAPRTAEVAVHGDAALGLDALAESLSGLPARPRRDAELDEVRALCAKQIAEIEPQLSWVRALRGAIPDDGILVNELTQVGYLSQLAYPVYGPRTYLTPGYQGTLGYGFATALGAKAANPGKAVVSITGDGGFGWNLQELSTARAHGIGLVTVVFDDGAFGNVRRTQKTRFEGRVLGTTLANPDFVALASAFGVRGERATTPDELGGVLADALSGDEPALIHVPVGEMPSAWHLIHDFLARPRVES
ncbi:thiamine pyrophosphate-dependent enzyme [Actinomadura yumaensis]|nr:thiamine pyrophosphate-dependent enzyme [Actinomadura sp. J1-007]